MRIEYDPNWVEQVAFLAARRERALERDFHRSIDGLYALGPGHARDAAFAEAYAEFFRRLGLDSVLAGLLKEPVLGGHVIREVARCVVREAARSRDESAELRVRPVCGEATPDDRTLIVQLTPASMLDRDRLEHGLRRELLHVADMLNPAFGYDKRSLEGRTPERNLVRDRYRVLWDIYVETRLDRCHSAGRSTLPRLCDLFTSAFGPGGAASRSDLFDSVINAAQLDHAMILSWARAGCAGVESEGDAIVDLKDFAGFEAAR